MYREAIRESKDLNFVFRFVHYYKSRYNSVKNHRN